MVDGAGDNPERDTAAVDGLHRVDGAGHGGDPGEGVTHELFDTGGEIAGWDGNVQAAEYDLQAFFRGQLVAMRDDLPPQVAIAGVGFAQ